MTVIKKKPLLTKNNTDLLKWFVGTVVLGSSTFISTCVYQNKELQIKKTEGEQEIKIKNIEADSKLIEAISRQFDTSSRSQTTALYYYNFIEPFVTTDKIKNALDSQIKVMNAPLLLITAASHSTSDIIDANARKYNYNASSNSSASGENQVSANIISENESKDSGLAKINKKLLDSLMWVTQNLSLEKLRKINNVKASVPLFLNNEPGYGLVGPASQQWFKDGYYREFNGTLRVGLNSLDGNAQVIYVRCSDIDGDVLKGYENVPIALGAGCTIIDADFKYIISFDFIGAAGKNPFTKAAYITVTTYKKISK